MRTRRRLGLAWGLLGLGTACSERPEPPPLPRAEALVERARAGLQQVDFYKPDAAAERFVDPYLAPLLLFEAGDGIRFGALEGDPEGALRVNPARPTVYFTTSTALLGGRELLQLGFLWWTASGSSGPEVQGVRLTLRDDGFPVIAEVLCDASGLRPIYVSESLEQAAAAQFGAPLPDRRFSVERSSDEQPTVIVPTLLEDGPVPMGPFVYLLAGSADVATLLCRCSPARFESVVTSADYELEPLETLLEVGLEEVVWARGLLDGRPPDADERPEDAARWLARCLRLPREL